MPAAPMMKNMERQPLASSRAVSRGGAIAGPRAEEALNNPIGQARSGRANQLEQTLVPPRYIGDSPRPRAARAMANCVRLAEKALAAWAQDQSRRPAPRVRRGP